MRVSWGLGGSLKRVIKICRESEKKRLFSSIEGPNTTGTYEFEELPIHMAV